MNDEFELQKRLRNADPGVSAPALNEGIVAAAALNKKRGFSSFRAARLTLAAASLSIVGLAISTLSLNLGTSSSPLFELASAGSNQAPMSANSRAESSPMISDKMIWQPVSYNYVAGNLSSQTGQGRVYQAELVGDPVQILRTLANVFGISGEPSLDEWSTPEFSSYSIQDENRSLGMYFSGTGSWYYSSWSNFNYGCPIVQDTRDNSEQKTDGLDERKYCDPKPTPELIPPNRELLSQAQQIFSSLGIRLDTAAARIYRDDWGASISFPNIQNGVETGQDYYLGWGMDGKLSYASGHSFRLVERGQYKTVSPLDAYARISDWRWFGGAPSSYFQSITATTEPAVLPSNRDAKGEDRSFEPGTDFIEVEPQVIDLLVNRSETATLTVFDASGNLWFVPGHLLFNDQGWFDSIIALEEGVIALPEPMDFEIMPYLLEPAVD